MVLYNPMSMFCLAIGFVCMYGQDFSAKTQYKRILILRFPKEPLIVCVTCYVCSTSVNMAHSNLLFMVKGRFSLAPGVNVIIIVSVSHSPWTVGHSFYKAVLSPP